MSKQGISSTIGVPFPTYATTSSTFVNTSNLTSSGSISASSDLQVSIGEPTKRFKSAYVDSTNTGSIYSYVNKQKSQQIASVIDSLPHKLIVSDSVSRGVGQGNDFKNKNWVATNYNTFWGGSASEFLSKYIPELKTWFFIPTVSSVNNQIKYCFGSPSTRLFNGGTINHLFLGQSADLVYSPDHDILLYTCDNTSSTGAGGISTFYSRDRGLSWSQCVFPNNATNQYSFSLAFYVSAWKCFFVFAQIATTNQQSRGLYPIMKSYDGVNFIAESPLSLPSLILTYSSTTQRMINSVDFDPSRNILAIGMRSVLVDENRVYYTEDGTNWLSSNTQGLSVRGYPLTLPNGQTLLDNAVIPFNHPSTGNNELFLNDGVYTITSLMTEIQNQFLLQHGVVVSVTQNSSTGVISFDFGAFSTSFTWGSSLFGTLHNELGFAKSDVGPSTILTGTFGIAVGQGYQTHIAYSPPLDMWVRASSNNTSLTSANVSWTVDITGTNKNSKFGFWNQNIIQPLTQFGTGNPIPQFGYIKWIDTLQMFMLINQSPNYTGNDTRDRSLWYSLDGITFSSTQNSTAPKLTTNSTDLNNKSLSFDPDSKTLIISHGIVSAALRTYDFSNFGRQTILSLPGWQAGTFTSPAVTAGVNTWVITFDKPFAVAPTGILLTPTSATTNVANYLFWFVSAITTTTFTISANSTLAGTGAAITWSYMAWEKP